MIARQHLVVMGVSGSGKTTIGRLLAAQLGRPFAEGDDFHPPANVAKMAAGIALTDQDRWLWLEALRDWMSDRAEQGVATVSACSALRRAYRDVLRQATGEVFFLDLNPARALVDQRLAERTGHFMPRSLLRSQYAVLQPLGEDEEGLVIDSDRAPRDVVDDIVQRLSQTSTQRPGPG